jgi:hypothetical protein
MPGHRDIPAASDPAVERHLGNVAENLQLVADLGYGDVALAVAGATASLTVGR